MGNRAGTTVDAGNRLLEDATYTYQYDNNGNMTQKTNRTTGEITTLTYDTQNRLVQVAKPGTTASYKYDPLGRRIEKNVNGIITKYLYDGEDIIIEYDGNGNMIAKYTHGLGIDEPLSIQRNGQSYYYHLDGLGSVTGLTDSTGNIVQKYTYDSFGNIVSVLDPNFKQPYTYTAREYDSETGMYYYRARYYDARTGKFISEDPIGLAGGINLYSYTANNPVNFVDPLGLLAFFWHEGITYVAARNSGYGVMDSLSLAFNTAAVDFSGSQGQSPADTVQHAMAGKISPKVWQSPTQAITATNAYIQSSINSGNLPGAIHAAQDLATPAHAGERWRGFGLNWETFKHIYEDIDPTWSTIKNAYQNTKQCFK